MNPSYESRERPALRSLTESATWWLAVAVLVCLPRHGYAVESMENRTDQQASSHGGSVPTLEELKNTTYKGFKEVKGPVTLVNGKWEGEPYEKGVASRPEVTLVGDFRLTGDLDGDGTDEAVVLLNLTTGGTGQLLYLAVVDHHHGTLQNIATKLVGDRVQIRGGRIEDGRIFLDVVQAGPKDAACCPGEVTTQGWTLGSRGKLIPFRATDKPGRLTLATLGGAEWVLRAWDIDEPAPEAPEVTLMFTDGRFVGSGGCNRYFAQAKEGDLPGELVVGPAGSTRMACPEPVMAVETRFLAQLGHVKKFSFLVTRLALSYEKDGIWKTMLFERRAQEKR